MMVAKTGIELLREYARSEKATNCKFFQEVSGKLCEDLGTCNECVSYAFKVIAKKIERETFPRPRFEDGDIACIGEEYEDKQGETHQILGFFFDDCDFTPVCIGIPREYSHGERLKRPYHDTQERIDDDATMPAAAYCVRHGLVDSDSDVDDATLLKLNITDLLRRQRELCEREAGSESWARS